MEFIPRDCGLMSRVLVVLWAACGSVLTNQPVERPTIYGRVRGFVHSVQPGLQVDKFLGVPYAKPPVGALRFEAPEPPDSWQGVRDATELPSACLQHYRGRDYSQIHEPDVQRFSEDCLYLNLFVPRSHHRHHHHGTQHTNKSQSHHRAGLAVIVFVHGGSYEFGTGAILDGTYLATYNVIVVTFNYRLGALGFLQADDQHLSGNYGLLDMVAALRWVQDNIHFFGGDPTRVTIDGHSAGGCSVGLLMLMPLAKGLFTRVIQQSGSPLAHWAVERQPGGPRIFFKLFTDATGCDANSTLQIKICLQKLSTQRIEDVIRDLVRNSVSMIPSFRPTVDGNILPDWPERLAAHGEINAFEILTGTTTDEGRIQAYYILTHFNETDHTDHQNLTTQVNPNSWNLLLKCMYILSADMPNLLNIIDLVVDQYFSFNNLDKNAIFKGISEIIGDLYIAAPTHKMADILSARNVTVFVYNFDYIDCQRPHNSVISKFVYHGSEIFFLSGNPMSGKPIFDTYLADTIADQNVATGLMTLWANFAKNGLPSLHPHLAEHLLPYRVGDLDYTQISARDQNISLTRHRHYKPDRMSFWNHRLPELYLQNLYSQTQQLGDSSLQDSGRPNTRGGTGQICHSSRQSSENWILIATCVGLSSLVVLLSVCYCRLRRVVGRLQGQDNHSQN